MESKHISVLLEETIKGLCIQPDGCYVDCTLGGGGHSEEICKALSCDGTLIGIDQDQYALERAEKRLASYSCHKVFVQNNFKNLADILIKTGYTKVDGIVFDLGVSSFQFDQADRGFSYRFDGPLDMRMDRRQDLDAKKIVNHYTEEQLKKILWEYGEEKLSGKVASAIVRARKEKPITTTLELASIVSDAYPAKLKRKKHPAKKTFQALRIEVNQELAILKGALTQAIDHLKPGGRLCVISFHSLEDRQVKQCFNTQSNPCTCPKEFPQCICGKVPTIKKVSRKPILPDAKELEENRRAHSAKLRIVERVEGGNAYDNAKTSGR